MKVSYNCLRRVVRFFNRKRLHNTTFSLITNNCIGGIISHDLHLRFLSPTINLDISNEDFIRFLEHLDLYLTLDLIRIQSDEPYPVGLLRCQYGDVVLHFQHYKSFDEAKDKWKERACRVDFSNLYIIWEAKKCDSALLQRFSGLPFQNKVVITDRKYLDLNCIFPMKKGFYSSNYQDGKILKYPRYGLLRYLDRFDYVFFFNCGKIRRRFL